MITDSSIMVFDIEMYRKKQFMFDNKALKHTHHCLNQQKRYRMHENY